MIASNLIVNGSSRFLNKIYCTDLSVSGATTFATVTATGLTVNGDATITGHTSLGGYANTTSKLSVNGVISNEWYRSAGNVGWYSQSYGGGIWMKDTSYIRTYGSKHFFVEGANLYVGSTNYYFSSAGVIQAANVNSPAATIDRLFVPGELRALQYNIQSINNLGGSFLIGPTINVPAGNNVNVTAISGTTITATITGSFSTSTFPTVIWAANSKIKISGKIGGISIGTCDGKLTAAITSSSIQVQFTYGGQTTKPLTVANSQASVDLDVMIYTVGTDKPIGIYMTSWGDTSWADSTAHNKSSISIYGGTSSSDVAPTVSTPVVRIGNLSGLPAVNGTNPTGWGIYTQHGYFSGMIVSNAGKIGNFNLSDKLYTGSHSTWNHASNGMYIASDGIAGGNGGTWYLWNDGTGKIGKYTFASNGALTTGSGTTQAGMGGTQAFWAGSSTQASAPFRVGYDGTFVATSATITGTIHATGGEFGNPYGTHMTFDDNSIEIQSRTRVFAKFSENELVLTRNQPDGKAIITPDGYYLRDENDDSLYRNQLLFTDTTSCLIAEYDTSLNKYVVQLPIPYLILRSIKVKELDSSSETTYTDCSSYYVSDYLRVISPSQQPGIQLTVKYLPEFGYICSKIGINNLGTGANSFALGRGNIMESAFSIACGDGNEVRSDNSAAFGDGNIASGFSSFVCGTNNYATMPYQTVIGKYNVLDTRNQNAFIVGNGSNDSNRSNAFEVSWYGDINTAGGITADGDIVASGSVTASWFVGNATSATTATSCSGNAATATKLSAAQKVYVTLGTASTTTTIQGGSTSAQTIGVNGTLGIGNGGTGKTSWTQYGLVYASATNALSQLGLGISGQLLMAKGSAAPEWVYQNDINSGKTGNGGIYLYANNNNEINFGGSNTSTTIYVGYRGTDSRGIPTSFIFGGSSGSASITANNITANGNLSVTGTINGDKLSVVTSDTITNIITVNSTNATITAANVVKYGRIVQLRIAWTNKSAISVGAGGNIGNIVIGTLKAGYIPTIFSHGWSNGDDAGEAWYSIRTDGQVQLGAMGTGYAHNIAAGTTFNLAATYIV